MIIQRTTSASPEFQKLARELERDLAIRDGDRHAVYAEFNRADSLPMLVVAIEDGVSVGCGAIRPYDEDSMELKRMFVRFNCRGRGIAAAILGELEKWSAELGCKYCILETGKNQPEAIGLYSSNGYAIIPRFGGYIDCENSICFRKVL